jgi:hypothetical protein
MVSRCGIRTFGSAEMEQKPPDVMLLGPEWRERALL